jgi:hypothetical protein
VKADPLGTPRHPLVVYLLALAVISGLGILLGGRTTGSIQDTLDPLARNTWAVILTLGSSTTLAGMFWPGDQRTGLLLKRFGYLALAIASFVYAIVVITVIGSGATLFGGTLVGFGVACALMVRRIDRIVKATIP